VVKVNNSVCIFVIIINIFDCNDYLCILLERKKKKKIPTPQTHTRDNTNLNSFSQKNQLPFLDYVKTIIQLPQKSKHNNKKKKNSTTKKYKIKKRIVLQWRTDYIRTYYIHTYYIPRVFISQNREKTVFFFFFFFFFFLGTLEARRRRRFTRYGDSST